jgi:predicted DNA-binding transcriptional regulator AlpA
MRGLISLGTGCQGFALVAIITIEARLGERLPSCISKRGFFGVRKGNKFRFRTPQKQEVLAPMAMDGEPETARDPTEEYLTVPELSARIKFSKQSLYNFIHKGTFILGKHFLKPTPKKILFKWSAIQSWMGESSGQINARSESPQPVQHANARKRANLIHI